MRVKKILIIATRQIGDTLITTPLVSALNKKWPDAQINFLGYQNSMHMLTGNSDIHELIAIKPRPSLMDYLKQFFQLFQRYDLAFITQPSDRAYIYGLVAARHRVGVIPSEPKLNWWKKKVCLHTVEVDYFHQHVITEKLRLMEKWLNNQELFGAGISVTPPQVVEIPADIQGRLSNSTIVIHPTPLTAYKRWPLANWVKLIEILSKNYQIILSGAPIAQDRELNQSIIDLLSPTTKEKIINLDGRLKLDQLGTLLRQTNLYIGVDTSVTHLAAACNALFGNWLGQPCVAAHRGEQLRASASAQAGCQTVVVPVRNQTFDESGAGCVGAATNERRSRIVWSNADRARRQRSIWRVHGKTQARFF